jgi:hypothetical protein
MRVLPLVAVGAVLSACGGRVHAGATGDVTGDASAYDGGEDGASEEAGSTVVVLASGNDACARNIVVDATSVYWTADDGSVNEGSVMKVPIDGGTPTTLASGQSSPWGVAVDATRVYWFNRGGSVMKVPLEGGSPVILASEQVISTGSLALDAARLYWGGNGGIAAMPLEGGTPELILSAGSPTIFGVDSTSVYFASANSGSIWTDANVSGILKAPLDGGAAVSLAPGTSLAGTLQGTSLYYLVGQDVMTVPIVGGAPVTLASSNEPPLGIAADSTRVYWTANLQSFADGGLVDEGKVMSVPSAGGTTTTLADALPQPIAIAVDATSVYRADGGTPGHPCSIKKLTPK